MAIKSREAKSGCFAKASPKEPLFVLRAQDGIAPTVVRMWALLAELMGTPREKLDEALACADAMEAWPKRKVPD